jgi:hypothetical protein
MLSTTIAENLKNRSNHFAEKQIKPLCRKTDGSISSLIQRGMSLAALLYSHETVAALAHAREIAHQLLDLA